MNDKHVWRCPVCGKPGLLFPEYWKCLEGHTSPHPAGEKKRLASIQLDKRIDHSMATWRHLDEAEVRKPKQTLSEFLQRKNAGARLDD